MHTPTLFIGLLIIICALAVMASRLRVSYPIIFLLSGIALGFIQGFVPGVPAINIPPHYILPIFLPPLLMEAAFFTSYRDFRFNLRSILQLSVGLVVVSAVAVAFVFEWLVPHGGWIAGLVLGAIVSPPDAIAATSIVRHLPVPKRIVSILEGESLINDATGLVLYKIAVAAAVSGSISITSASGAFLQMVLFGALAGVTMGYAFVFIYPRVKEANVEIILTFLTPYLAYFAAESVHGSGVLAVVIGGLIIGWYGPTIFQAQQRLPTEAIWKLVTFVLTTAVFLMIGLTLPGVLKELSAYSLATLLWYAFVICVTAVVVRIAYVFALTYGMPYILPRRTKKRAIPAWQNVFIIAWTGMRGVVSLATALALPFALLSDTDEHLRALIIFLSLSVIIFTLVIQGLSLPFILRRLKLKFNANLLWEDWEVRSNAALAALEQVKQLEPDDPEHRSAWKRIYTHYQDRLTSLGDGPNTPLQPTEEPSSHTHPLLQAENKIWQRVIEIERDVVITMRGEFKISDDIMHNILNELDLLESRFKVVN